MSEKCNRDTREEALSSTAAVSAATSGQPIPPSIHLLILITGSVAAVKTGLLLDQLHNERCHVRIAATTSAFHFLNRAQPSNTGIPFQSILTDQQEWDQWQAINDGVVHIELRKWADLVVMAPLDANSLAKIATGLCDNLVTCVMRAWEVGRKPVIVCPAMNTAMWTHPITAHQIGELRRWYSAPGTLIDGSVDSVVQSDLPETLEAAMFQLVGPVSKKLACGDVGMGGMAAVEEIAKYIRQTMALLRAEKLKTETQQLDNPSLQTPVGTSAEAEKGSSDSPHQQPQQTCPDQAHP